MPKTPDTHPLVRALKAVNRLYGRAYHRVELLTPCPIPASGAGILICNHSAGLDPVLLQAVCPRLLTWMMAKEYHDLPALRPIVGRLGFIPVTRGGRDSASLKSALRALEAGRMLGVFPEGRIAVGRRLLPFQPGVALMAARAGVPIYPAYIGGLRRNVGITRSLLEPQTATITFGPPIPADSSDGRLTDHMRAAVESLRNSVSCGEGAPKRKCRPVRGFRT